jgi:hypothetical protein
MKDEIFKNEAIEIAEYLHSKNLVTEGDVQDIKESSRWRKADEKLLKLVRIKLLLHLFHLLQCIT